MASGQRPVSWAVIAWRAPHRFWICCFGWALPPLRAASTGVGSAASRHGSAVALHTAPPAPWLCLAQAAARGKCAVSVPSTAPTSTAYLQQLGEHRLLTGNPPACANRLQRVLVATPQGCGSRNWYMCGVGMPAAQRAGWARQLPCQQSTLTRLQRRLHAPQHATTPRRVLHWWHVVLTAWHMAPAPCITFSSVLRPAYVWSFGGCLARGDATPQIARRRWRTGQRH